MEVEAALRSVPFFALVAKVREAIERLEEFRTALCVAATGGIDVRQEAAVDGTYDALFA